MSSEVLEVSYPTKEWDQWAQDFDEVRSRVLDLGVKRQLHRSHRKVLHQHEDVERQGITDGTVIVHHWMQENYADSMLIGLRRVVDRTGGSFSFVKLLERLEKGRPLITLDRYVQLWSGDSTPLDDSFLKMLFSEFSSDGRTLDRKKIRADIDTLLSDHDLILKYINSAIAHYSIGRLSNAPLTEPRRNLTWEDLDSLFDDITSLFNKYNALVRPGEYMDFESILPGGHEQAFHRMVIGQ